MTRMKRDPRECLTAKQKAPPRAERGEAKLIRLWGACSLADRLDPSQPSLHAPYIASVPDPRCRGASAIPSTKNKNGPVTLRVRAEAACPLGVPGDQNLRAVQHNERP
jgi:hypothetical protein